MNLNLENIKIGDEITIITPQNGGFKYNGIQIVSEWSETHKAYRLKSSRNGKDSGILPSDGKGYSFMSKRKNPDFFYSANPEHIAATKKQFRKKGPKEKSAKNFWLLKMNYFLPCWKAIGTAKKIIHLNF